MFRINWHKGNTKTYKMQQEEADERGNISERIQKGLIFSTHITKIEKNPVIKRYSKMGVEFLSVKT